MNPRAIKLAVELWKKLLIDRKYDNMGDTGTPDERSQMGMASKLASLIPANNTRDILEAFGDALTRILTDDPRSCQCGTTMTLGVDYGPDSTLARAAKEVGLQMEWPWKTVMWIRDDCVQLKSGYGAKTVRHNVGDPLATLRTPA